MDCKNWLQAKGTILGKGFYGTVYQKEFGGIKYAVKVLKMSSLISLEDVTQEVRAQELLALQGLAPKIHHFCHYEDEDKSSAIIVMDFIKGTPLYHDDGPKFVPGGTVFGIHPPCYVDLLDLTVVVVAGLVRLQESHMYHGDIHSENVLMVGDAKTKDWRIMFIDFGCSCAMAPANSASLCNPLSVCWRPTPFTLDETLYFLVDNRAVCSMLNNMVPWLSDSSNALADYLTALNQLQESPPSAAAVLAKLQNLQTLQKLQTKAHQFQGHTLHGNAQRKKSQRKKSQRKKSHHRKSRRQVRQKSQQNPCTHPCTES